MAVLNKVLSQAVAVTQALLSIAVGTIGAVKKGLAELARGAIDPLARSRVEKERERCEDRQIEIDNEKRDILKQAKRDSRWSADAIDRYEELNRESQAIAQKLGPRKSIEAASDHYDALVVDLEHMHRLEWYVGQATDKRCERCGLPMILQFPRDQVRDQRPMYFWGCTGWYMNPADPRRCTHTQGVSTADLGTLLRCDNEALAMDRAEMCKRAFDRTVSRKIGRDMLALQDQAFPAYRCPIHDIGMVLRKKLRPKEPLDVWHLKCPSPIPYNDGYGCSQTRKLKTVAQVLAVRHIRTGEVF